MLIRDSYGHLFINAILRASSPNLWSHTPNYARSDLTTYKLATSGTYAIIDPNLGINLDLMSYVSYKRSQQSNPEALTDQKTLLEQSQATFSLFFKHFVSSGISSDSGGWAFQKVGSRLEVGPHVQGYYETYGFGTPEPLLRYSFLPNGDPAPQFEDVSPRSNNQNGTATLTTSVEILSINKKAFWIATGILVSLTCIMVTFIILNQSYLGGIIRNVECIADKIVLIAGSERLLALVQEKGNRSHRQGG
jgi:hypothetical protein